MTKNGRNSEATRRKRKWDRDFTVKQQSTKVVIMHLNWNSCRVILCLSSFSWWWFVACLVFCYFLNIFLFFHLLSVLLLQLLCSFCLFFFLFTLSRFFVSIFCLDFLSQFFVSIYSTFLAFLGFSYDITRSSAQYCCKYFLFLSGNFNF